MKALVYHGPANRAYEEKPMPTIKAVLVAHSHERLSL